MTKGGKGGILIAWLPRKGTKVADVAWASSARFEQIKWEVECSIAPEICVEVRSSSNTDNEIEEKPALYFENGAQEVWICSTNGDIRFYNFSGELKQSELLAKFPNKIGSWNDFRLLLSFTC